MAEEVEVHPGVGASSFLASQHTTVEASRFIEVGDVEGKVEQAATQ